MLSVRFKVLRARSTPELTKSLLSASTFSVYLFIYLYTIFTFSEEKHSGSMKSEWSPKFEWHIQWQICIQDQDEGGIDSALDLREECLTEENSLKTHSLKQVPKEKYSATITVLTEKK